MNIKKSPYKICTKKCWQYDVVHSGLQGITEYLYKNKVPYNIHGHNHSTYNFKLKNGTQVLGTYLIEEITIGKKN